jgi:SAM-dependent methyltransferase
MECQNCGLVFAGEIFTDDVVASLYRSAGFADEPQLVNMRKDYEGSLRAVLAAGAGRGSLLEIGCANGFFLKKALEAGFEKVAGVEPGEDAFGKALPEVRPFIVNDIFHDGLFAPESFDVVCFFQVIDHILSPVEFLRSVRRVLRPGGFLLSVNHNISSWCPRLMGESSPMYDIEHIYLFDRRTMSMALGKAGFRDISVRGMRNLYTLGYCVKMFPMPAPLRRLASCVLRAVRADNLGLRVPAGNMVSTARR